VVGRERCERLAFGDRNAFIIEELRDDAVPRRGHRRERNAPRLLGRPLLENRLLEAQTLELRLAARLEARDRGLDLLDLDLGAFQIEPRLEQLLVGDDAAAAELLEPVEPHLPAFEVDAEQLPPAAGLPDLVVELKRR